MSTFDEQGFEKRLMNLKDTQESVSQLSHWCLVNKQHHKKIVALWLSVLKKVKIESRLTLFHLANDVIQYSKRKNLEFVESWGTALQRATPMVRDEKVQKKILRIFKIWGERSIYEETFLTDLCGLLTTTTKKSSAQSQSHSKAHHHEKPAPVAVPLVFEPQNLFMKIRDCVKLENDTDYKMKAVNECPLALNDVDSLRASLKDRRHGDEAVAEVEDAIKRMKAYEEALRIEVQERRTLIELLRHGETFYENERGEAKVVFNAYRNFGSRVKSVKRKLDEVLPTLSSPIPSPDVNAPSPSPDSDIDLPNDEDLSGIVECLQNSSSSDDEADPDLPKYKLKHLSARHRRRGLPLPLPGDVTLQSIDLDDEEFPRPDLDHYLYELALNECQSNESDNETDNEDFRLWLSSDEEEPSSERPQQTPVKDTSETGSPITPTISDRDPRLKRFAKVMPVTECVERTAPDSSSASAPDNSNGTPDNPLPSSDPSPSSPPGKFEPPLVSIENDPSLIEPVTSSQESEVKSLAPRTPSPVTLEQVACSTPLPLPVSSTILQSPLPSPLPSELPSVFAPPEYTPPEPTPPEPTPPESAPPESDPPASAPPESTSSKSVSPESASSKSAPPESVPLESAPLESAPLESAPLESAPLESAPLESAPLESAPLESAPLESAPLESAPLESAPLESAPLESAPLESAPLESVPSKRVPSECVPSECVSSESVPSECVLTEYVPSESVPPESSLRTRPQNSSKPVDPDSPTISARVLSPPSILPDDSVPMDISEEDLPGECDISCVLECMEMDMSLSP